MIQSEGESDRRRDGLPNGLIWVDDIACAKDVSIETLEKSRFDRTIEKHGSGAPTPKARDAGLIAG